MRPSWMGLALAALASASSAQAQATFYEHDGFTGSRIEIGSTLGDFGSRDFSDRASSVLVVGRPWELCRDAQFAGDCVVLQPGRYPSLREFGLNDRVTSARGLQNVSAGQGASRPVPVVSPPGPAQLVLHEFENHQGRTFTTRQRVRNLERFDFDDRASSVVVLGERWELCDGAGFSGTCRVLRPGRYPSLAAIGLGGRVSSARVVAPQALVDDARYSADPVPVYDGRRRGGERLYDVAIDSSRAVLATAGERCWVEAGRVAPAAAAKPNVGGAIVGALLGGILGHQVGGGSGKDLATVGGVVAGAAVGSQVGRDGERTRQAEPDVERCEAAPGGAQAAYWDVAYRFRGQDHRAQLAAAPGRTIRVNAQGQPRE
jgi:uncharacterized protein YcfJ